MVWTKALKQMDMKGVYVLFISVGQDLTLDVGALGPTFFEMGLYAYVGSAQNNLEKRLKRHFRKNKRRFWHVDYLIASRIAKVMVVFWKEGEKKLECEIARKIRQFGPAVKGFGSSDCSCEGHLIRVRNLDLLRQDMYELRVQPS